MTVPNPHVRFTYEDYKTLPESTSVRYELLDGDLVRIPAPTTSHQRISRDLEFVLMQFVREQNLGEIFDAPVDVVFGIGKDREVVQPDLLFISKERQHIVTKEEIRGAPDLVVEILSSGTEVRDRGYKKTLYGRYGVKEYWIVDPEVSTVEVYLPREAGLQLVQKYEHTEVLTSDLLPGVRIDLREVFEGQ